MLTRARKSGLTLALTAAVLAMAAPAAALDHPFDIEQTNGYIEVSGVQFPVPDDPIVGANGPCPEGDVSFSGSINDDGSVDVSVSGSGPFRVPFGGVKYLDLSGAGSGSWVDPPFHFEAVLGLDFEIWSYDVDRCEPVAPECFGSASLEVEGDENLDVAPTGIPPSSSGDRFAVHGSGQLDVVDRPANPAATSCPGLLGFAVYEGAAVDISGDFEQQ